VFFAPLASQVPLRAYANGDTPISESARICRDIGILRGDANGVTAEYLALQVTRLQAIYITLRLSGKESAALSAVARANFSDAYLVEDQGGKNVLAYAKAHPEYGWQGDQAGNVDPNGFVTAQAMYKVLLTVLGYSFDTDYTWDETIPFAGGKGLSSMAAKRGNLTNGDLSVMIVEALKTRKKDSEETLCEFLAGLGLISDSAAYDAAMLPGSPGFTPLLTYKQGGPLMIEAQIDLNQKKILMRFNTPLNPTYAKALKTYGYYMPGTGYMPLPASCSTSMADEQTVSLQFPHVGWTAYSERVETDAFTLYLASDRKNELRVSGLYDVDGYLLRDILLDFPAAPLRDADGTAGGGGLGSSARGHAVFLR
jgi:hypothetical protein